MDDFRWEVEFPNPRRGKGSVRVADRGTVARITKAVIGMYSNSEREGYMWVEFFNSYGNWVSRLEFRTDCMALIQAMGEVMGFTFGPPPIGVHGQGMAVRKLTLEKP